METHPRLKVLLVVEPGVDGVFRHVEGLAYFLRRQPGVQVHLAFSSLRGSPALEKLAAAVAAGGGRTLDLRVGNAPRPGDARAFARLWRLAREVRPDAVHAHSSKAGVLARGLALVGVQARFFYTPHAYFQMHGSAGNLKRAFFLAVERALGRVGTTIHVSPSEVAYARRELGLAPARQRLAYNGVDCANFRPAADAAEKRSVRARFNLPGNALVLGTVARFSPQKDPLTLYRALTGAMRRTPDLHFAHLGQGDLAAEVDGLLAMQPPAVRERFHRVASSEAPAAFYRALDGFVLPSRYEGLALAALEAMATDLPLLLTRCPGNTDLDGLGLNQLWWSLPGDVPALAENIATWADGRADGPDPGCNHREVLRERFDLERCYGRLLEFYRG